MRDHGGFEHNRQTLRILEVLERRYPSFPGLNLTWEVREGIIKHQPGQRRLRRPTSTRRARRPTLEAQLVDFVDEIAYNNHDVDDGLTSGMFTVEQIRTVPLFREAHDAALASRASTTSGSSATRWCAASSTAAREDLIEITLRQPAARRGWARWRTCAACGPAAGRATPRRWPAHVRELKDFLLRRTCTATTAWCAWGTRRAGSCATCSAPTWPSPASSRRTSRSGSSATACTRVVCDYIAGMTDRFALDEHRKLFDPTVRV